MDSKVIYGLLKEMREDQKTHGEKLAKHGEELAKQSICLKNLEEDVKDIKQDVSENKEDVAYHIKRTDILEALHKDNQEKIKYSDIRIKKLEEPVKAKAWIKKNYLTISSIIITTLSIVSLVTKFFGWW